MRTLYDLRLGKQVNLTKDIQINMNCNNKKTGCYHDNSIHMDGNGKCLVRGCKCEKLEL